VTSTRPERLLSFRIGTAPAALPLGLIREVIASPSLVPVPGSRDHVAGVALHYGVAVPVYDLERFDPLWCPEGSPRKTSDPAEEAPHLIVCAWGEALIGLLGGNIDLLESSETGATEAAFASNLRSEYLSGSLRSGEEVVAVFDAARLFSSLGVPAEVGGAREDAGEEDSSRR
jgi:chemotaxis signal transduction protein